MSELVLEPRPTRRRAGFLVGLCAGLLLMTASRICFAVSPTITTITLSSTSLSAGSPLTLTAGLTALGIPLTLGTIYFCDASATYCEDSALVGQAQLTAVGTASIKIIPSIGTHTYKVFYPGWVNYGSSTSTSSSVTVTGKHPTATVLTSTGSAGSYTLTGTVSSTGSLSTAPTGTVSFTDASNANYSLGSATLGSSVSAQTFPVAGTNSTGTGPRISASGDFNRDGIPDLAVANASSGSVTVLLGTGTGTFTAASGSPITTGSSAVSVATADFNNDGKLDLAVVNHASNSVSVLLGNGDGTFQIPINILGLNQPSAIAIGDFNRDGFLDAAVTSQGSNLVYILLGSGTGALTYLGVNYSTGSQPYSIIAADINADNSLDLVIGNSNASSVTVLLGNGNGTFAAAAGSPVATGFQPWSIALADLNGDGKPDLITANQGDANINILAGNGNGTFGAFTSYSLATGVKTLVVADFNGDGKQDVAVCNFSSSTLSILLGNGNNTFQTPTAALTPSIGSAGCEGMVAADLNGDGLPDIEVTSNSNSLSTVLLNTVTQTACASLSAVSIPGNGTHNIAATYAGDTLDAASSSATTALTATKVATTLALAAAPTSSQYGQQVVLSATLSPYVIGGLATNGETITFTSGGVSVGTGTLTNGYALLNITTLPIGTDALTAVYATDVNFLGSVSATTNYTVSPATVTVTWATPSAITYGTHLSAVQLNASSGGIAGTLVYTPAAGTILSAGAAQILSVAFTPTNTALYNSASGSTTITVTQAAGTVVLTSSSASAAYAAPVTLTATVPANASGTVTFLDGGNPIGTGTISGTTATFTSSGLAVGTHTLTASWPGNTNYTSALSSSYSQTIVRAAATIVEALSLNPSSYGDKVTMSVALSGGGVTPTGTVLLRDGAAVLGTVTLNAGGLATFATSVLTAGSHTLTATYQGDTHYF